MVRSALSLVLPFLAVAAFAQTNPDLAGLTQIQAELKGAMRLTRARAAVAAAQAQPPAASASSGVAALRCRAVNGDPYYSLNGQIDLKSKALTTDRGGKAVLLNAALGAKLVDERCGTTAAPIASSDNYDVTPPHYWGEDIFQLPLGAVPASGTATVSANLHTCMYDGDWSSSSDTPVTCEIAVK